MDTPDLLSGGLGALLGGLVTQFGNWATKRAEKAPDIQETLNTAVAGVVKHYTDALASERSATAELRSEVAELRRVIEEQTKRIEEQGEQIAEQATEIGGLNAHIEALTAALVAAGLNPPSRRKRVARQEASE